LLLALSHIVNNPNPYKTDFGQTINTGFVRLAAVVSLSQRYESKFEFWLRYISIVSTIVYSNTITSRGANLWKNKNKSTIKSGTISMK